MFLLLAYGVHSMVPQPDVRKSPQNSISWLRRPISAALVSALVVFLLAALVVQHLQRSAQREIQLEMEYWAKAFATKLRGQLDANLAVGYGLEAQISVLGDLDQAGLNQVAPRLLHNPTNIRHIALAPNLVVSALYPLAGNERALGLDYRNHPEQREDALLAMQTKQVVLAGPVMLVQGGGEHLIARFPIFLPEDKPWGLVALVIAIPALLKDSGLEPLQARYDLALRRLDTRTATAGSFFGNPELFSVRAQVHSIEVPGGAWQLAIQPRVKPHWRAIIYWLLNGILSALVGAVVFYLRRFNQERDCHLHELARITAIDPLTQLTSRYQFNHYLNQFIEECQRTGQGFTLLFIDLDHFKEINDSLGHAAGDQLLIDVARTLKNCVRSYDLLCRLGGDEFIVVLKNITKTAEIENRASIITAGIAEHRSIKGVEVSVTCSVGIAVYPTDGVDAASLIQHADLAMYESKRTGRNTLYFFNMTMRNEADRYVELSGALKAALLEGQFAVYYQPIYDPVRRCFSRCEALCRWPQADGSMIPPAEFIPVAEQSGLISDLGMWIMDEVMQTYRELAERGQAINFCVNRSPVEFASKQHTLQLINLRKRWQIPPEALTLEITESLLMADHNVKTQNFLTLKDQQFQFSIDDFGTGYSAINYLRQYPVESLKIDRSFIAELGVSHQADTLVKIIVQMAKSLNIRVVAEGVETQQQVDFLAAIECDYLQGYFFAKPMPKAQFMEFLMAHSGH